MTPDDELDQRLRDLADEPVPAPDPRFVVRLEHVLRDRHSRPLIVWWRRPRLTVPLALGTALAATVLGLVLAGPPRAGVETEGTGIAGQPARTTIADEGRDVPAVTSVPQPGVSVVEVPPADPDDLQGGGEVEPGRVETGETPTTTAPNPSATTAPEPVDPDAGPTPTTTPADGPTTTTTPPRTTTTSTTPSDRPTTTTSRPDSQTRTFRASATRRDQKTVVIRWTAQSSDRVASYRVVRRPPDGTSGPTVVVAHRRAAADQVAIDEIERDAEYVVQAVDADGRVIATTAPTSP